MAMNLEQAIAALDKRIEDMRVEVQASIRSLNELTALRASIGTPPKGPHKITRLHAEAALRRQGLDQKILDLVGQFDLEGIRAIDVSQRLDIPKGTASSRLSTLKVQGRVRNQDSMWFCVEKPLANTKVKIVKAMPGLKDTMRETP